MSRSSTIALSMTALAAAAALTACSSGSDGGSGGSSTTTNATTNAAAPATTPVTTPATTPATTTTVTKSAGSGSSNGGSDNLGGNSGGDSGGGTPQCAESQLRAGAAALDFDVPRHVVRLTFANKSDRTCTLTGFPGAAIVDSSGKQVRQAKRIVGGVVGGTAERNAPIKLKPRASVFAFLEGASTKETGAAQAGCDGPKFPRILVTPPNTKIAVPFTVGWPQCYSFNIHPVRPQ